MADNITYYAIADCFTSRDEPAGILRRVQHPGGHRDEAYGRDWTWVPTGLLYSAERGNLDNELHAISATEAARHMRRLFGPPRPRPLDTLAGPAGNRQ